RFARLGTDRIDGDFTEVGGSVARVDRLSDRRPRIAARTAARDDHAENGQVHPTREPAIHAIFPHATPPAPNRSSRTLSVGSKLLISAHSAGPGHGSPARFSQTARMPAARAPSTSEPHESPSMTASSAGALARASARRKIAASGFRTPTSSEITSA